MQLGVISPFFRCHTSKNGNRQEPWQFGPQVENLSRSAIGERYRLLCYLYCLAHHATLSGEPILRPLVYEFQDDAATYAVGDQAMLGPFLLAAPVLQKGATSRKVYLPPDRWYDFWSGTVLDGPATVELEVALGSLPLFVRAGAILPTTEPMAWSDFEPPSTLYFDLFPGIGESTFAYYEDDGDGFGYQEGDFSRIEYVLKAEPGALRFAPASREGRRAPGRRRLVVRLWNAAGYNKVELNGRQMSPITSEDSLSRSLEGWQRTKDGRISVVMPEDWEFALRFLA